MTESSIKPPPLYQASSNSSSSADPAAMPEFTFELLLTLIYAFKHVCTPNRKTRTIKPESENKEPYNISIKTEWDAFLNIIADKLAVGCSNLAILSFEWHWLKPASGSWLLIQDENGFVPMLNKIKLKQAMKVNVDLYVITRM
jgi:hypothetical protein